jgi:hypothetical protein
VVSSYVGRRPGVDRGRGVGVALVTGVGVTLAVGVGVNVAVGVGLGVNDQRLARTQLVPWLAKMDSNGNYLWQYFYFDIGPTTGRILSEYFASSAYASDGGFLSLGEHCER